MAKTVQDLCEKQCKLIVDSVNSTDKHFISLALAFASYNKHDLRTLNKFDEVANVLKQYSESGSNGENTSNVLMNFAKAMALLGDFRQLQIQRIENCIIPELQQYDLICKNTKDNVKEISIMRDKEVVKAKQIYQIKHKNDNLYRKKSGSTDHLDESKTFHLMTEIVENFERQKLHDLKQVLLNFILIQMKHHSKALEVLTATYQDVADIDEIEDLEKIQKKMLLPIDDEKQSFKNIRSQSLSALSSMFPSTSARRPKKPSNRYSSTKSVGSSQDEDDEETGSGDDKRDHSTDSDGSDSSGDKKATARKPK